MKIILCGYHWAGCRALDLLLHIASELYVFTHDAPYHIPDLKSLCKARNIAYTTNRICLDNMPFVPDVLVSIYYREIIPFSVIQFCNQKTINLHPSLLPAYRGCGSLTWALINNEREVGFTYHYIDQGIDTGNIILQKSLQIFDWDTQATLYYRVMFEALNELIIVVQAVLKGEVGRPQQGVVSYYRRGSPLKGEIQLDWPIDKVQRFIRAMTFPPYPPAKLNGREILSLEDYINHIKPITSEL